MKTKRILAYLIDIFLVAFISSIIFMLPIFKNEYTKYDKYYNEYINSITTKDDTNYTIEEQIDDIYIITKSSQSLYIINLGVTIIYFGVITYIWKGKSIGKKLLKIKIVSIKNDLNPNLYMLRQVIITNLIPKTLSIISIILLDKNTWYTVNTLISYLTYSTYFLILGFMIFRTDERGLHDLIGQTQVVSM